ncbi:YSC84-related protein [Paraburkholderia silviterrae]|uniref:Twin-arginine translocation pathway signal protein n=1 Tax=Paraburkholderia silviterrae TaxID=2528715 RepID=A0A4R5MCM1_9BURK|nr:YSC84-related protein [Paraburkholderia silviterrae]TDG24619.1 twin-arginine translocation pathway signal protein [Paraburkholderia silviterrae]
MSLRSVRIATLLSALLVAACSTTLTNSPTSATSAASSRAQLEQAARKALNTLYETTPAARALGSKSAGILVFPSVLKAGFLFGGSGGNGVLFSARGEVLGYYNSSALSWGLQAGAQNFSEAMFLMTPQSMQYLDNSAGWSVGVGPSVVVADSGMATDLSTTTARSDVYAFIYGQSGIMAGLGVQGQKITRLNE